MRDETEVDELEEIMPADGWADISLGINGASADWLSAKVDEFLASGGTIKSVPIGASAHVFDNGDQTLRDMAKVAQRANNAKQARKQKLEPARLKAVQEALAEGIKGLSNLSKTTGIGAQIIKDLQRKYGFEIPAVPKSERGREVMTERETGIMVAAQAAAARGLVGLDHIAAAIDVHPSQLSRMNRRWGWNLPVKKPVCERPDRTVEIRQKMAEAFALRRQGKEWKDIAVELGVSWNWLRYNREIYAGEAA